MKDYWKTISVILLLAASMFGLFSLKTYHDLKLKELDIQEAVVHEAAETERTEERSQFWQKAIPWGKDESE